MKLITYNKISKFFIFSFLYVSIASMTTKKIEAGMNLGSETTGTTMFEFMKNLELVKLSNATSAAEATSNSTVTNVIKTPSGVSMTSSFIVDLKDPNSNLEDWLTVSSKAFRNRHEFPIVRNPDGDDHQIKYGAEQERINEKFTISKGQNATNIFEFWFKVKGGYMYYFAVKDDINVLGSILVNKAINSKEINKHSAIGIRTCFDVEDMAENKYHICAETVEIKWKWLCSIQSFIKQLVDPRCNKYEINYNETRVVINEVTQPVIIIPSASRNCNDKWNYDNKGRDWECNCKEGTEQSPIDLPTKEQAILSNLRPMFQYENVMAKAIESTLDGAQIAGEYVKIRYDGNAIRIHHPNMGKIVALDGGVFVAEEITIHTPSEHTINGQAFDMEMHIVHFGKSKGDIAKQIVLSFLFKAKPGRYNKFLEKLDFFNLPGPLNPYRDITNDFFIPDVFYTTEDDDISTMQPFSFYTYQGSITSPPCTERTTHYVAADPIELSNTVIQLFKEALKTPDLISEQGQVYQNTDDSESDSTRAVQPLNGRPVFVFDHVKYNCPEFKRRKRDIKPDGHYEKREIPIVQYVYVNSDKPTGIPGSFVVPEHEAKGLDESITEKIEDLQKK